MLLREAADGYERLRAQIGKAVIGHERIVRHLLAAVLSGGHVLVVGVPGLAKTLLVRTLAGALGWSFKRIQFTPDMMPADVIGMELLQEPPGSAPGSGESGGGISGGGRTWRFMKGPIFANLVLADEINRTPPRTQAALLEAMQERTVTSMGTAHRLEEPFVVVATQNPIEQEGTYPLPEAQLDRFMLSLWMDYPSVEEEEAVVAQTTGAGEPAVERVLDPERMRALAGLVRRMPASRHVVSYAVAIARATRPDDPSSGEYVREYVEWGAGPRAGQQMVLAAKALAALDGRPAVSAEHIREAAPGVLRHRVLVNYMAGGEGVGGREVVERVMMEVKEPEYGRND